MEVLRVDRTQKGQETEDIQEILSLNVFWHSMIQSPPKKKLKKNILTFYYLVIKLKI